MFSRPPIHLSLAIVHLRKRVAIPFTLIPTHGFVQPQYVLCDASRGLCYRAPDGKASVTPKMIVSLSVSDSLLAVVFRQWRIHHSVDNIGHFQLWVKEVHVFDESVAHSARYCPTEIRDVSQLFSCRPTRNAPIRVHQLRKVATHLALTHARPWGMLQHQHGICVINVLGEQMRPRSGFCYVCGIVGWTVHWHEECMALWHIPMSEFTMAKQLRL